MKILEITPKNSKPYELIIEDGYCMAPELGQIVFTPLNHSGESMGTDVLTVDESIKQVRILGRKNP